MEAYKAEVSNKADTSLNAFKDTVGSTWGAKSAALRGIYLAVVHPQMLYGAIFCFDPGLITHGLFGSRQGNPESSSDFTAREIEDFECRLKFRTDKFTS
ncbi:hypothetical protein NYO67_1862 [Aspergillus flavus]|nr:hypothetical protein NYO67_1862 [Aspergillus flavus]